MGAWTREDWNDIIQRVNNLAPECPDVAPLAPVGSSHLWSKTDIRDVQDKLRELCEDNTFNAVPDLWKQAIIDDLNAAIARGVCCCEEKDLIYPKLNTWAPNGFKVINAFAGSDGWLTFDWAGWIMQEQTPPFDQEIPLATGETLAVPSGGAGWVGRDYRYWQVFLDPFGSPPSTPVAEGVVADGYIVIGDALTQAAAVNLAAAKQEERKAIVRVAEAQVALDESIEHGTPVEIEAAREVLEQAQATLDAVVAARRSAQAIADTNPPARSWPWIVDFIQGGWHTWTLIGTGPDAYFAPLPDSAYMTDRNFVAPSRLDSPFTISTLTAGAGVLRLMCGEPADA